MFSISWNLSEVVRINFQAGDLICIVPSLSFLVTGVLRCSCTWPLMVSGTARMQDLFTALEMRTGCSGWRDPWPFFFSTRCLFMFVILLQRCTLIGAFIDDLECTGISNFARPLHRSGFVLKVTKLKVLTVTKNAHRNLRTNNVNVLMLIL